MNRAKDFIEDIILKTLAGLYVLSFPAGIFLFVDGVESGNAFVGTIGGLILLIHCMPVLIMLASIIRTMMKEEHKNGSRG